MAIQDNTAMQSEKMLLKLFMYVENCVCPDCSI